MKLLEHFDRSPVPIRIPSRWNVNSFAPRNGSNFVTFPNYPKKCNDANIVLIKKSFTVPASWKGKQLFLYFQAVAGNAIYYLNGRKIGENFDIFFPYEMNISKWVKRGGSNELIVGFVSPKL